MYRFIFNVLYLIFYTFLYYISMIISNDFYIYFIYIFYFKKVYKYRSASIAAIHPDPAAVIAWR